MATLAAVYTCDFRLVLVPKRIGRFSQLTRLNSLACASLPRRLSPSAWIARATAAGHDGFMPSVILAVGRLAVTSCASSVTTGEECTRCIRHRKRDDRTVIRLCTPQQLRSGLGVNRRFYSA